GYSNGITYLPLAGLSPRMRGTADFIGFAIGRSRFIPADAGNGSRQLIDPVKIPVYPRGCGERSQMTALRLCIRGLSPRMRGTAPNGGAETLDTRFIPADAGNGALFSPQQPAWPVYPRGCGERFLSWRMDFRNCGLSPRMRGTAAVAPRRLTRPRFIPADAGNGAPLALKTGALPVYPRGCGERMVCAVWRKPCSGLSPRMRGTAISRAARSVCSRFIPADAGNGAAQSGYSVDECGLSPRMRG